MLFIQTPDAKTQTWVQRARVYSTAAVINTGQRGAEALSP